MHNTLNGEKKIIAFTYEKYLLLKNILILQTNDVVPYSDKASGCAYPIGYSYEKFD